MSDKAKFHSMTKPIRFRKLKQLKQIIVSWAEGLRERILYLFNYILYKLHILKRYSYRDNVEKVIPRSLKEKEVSSKCIKGLAKMRLVSEREVDVDYFYRERKDGSKKITYTVRCVDETRLYSQVHLEEIQLRVVDRWYNTNNLPIFKAQFYKGPIPFDPQRTLEMDSKLVKTETICFDLKKVKQLFTQNYLGMMDIDQISTKMLKFYYDRSCEHFERKLSETNLEDLMIRR